MARRFTKIKYDGKTVFLQYQQGPAFKDEYSMKCRELPRPEFAEALKALAPEVLYLCELATAYLNRIKVRSVSLNYGGKGETMGATITSQMDLYNSNCPLNLNTPNKPVEPYNTDCEYDDDTLAKMCLRGECVDKLEDLIDEANKYVDGQRAQGSLFDNVDGKESNTAA